MGTTERRQREKDNLRRAILDAARELFVTDGFDNVSMRKIADKIEYSATTIYLHFKDKDEIFVALAEEGFTLLAERLEPLHIRIADPIERLRFGCHEYFNFSQEQANYYKIMFELKASPLRTAMHDKYTENFETSAGFRAFSFIMRCVGESIAQGRIPNRENSIENVGVLSHVVWASIHGAASLILVERAVPFQCALPEKEMYQVMLSETVENTLRGLTACK